MPGRDQIHEASRQPALRLVIIEIGNVDQLARLLDERLGDGRVRVAERGHRDAAAEIEIALAGDVKNVTARAVAQHDIKAPVARHHVFLEQRLHARHIVAHDGRR